MKKGSSGWSVGVGLMFAACVGDACALQVLRSSLPDGCVSEQLADGLPSGPPARDRNQFELQAQGHSIAVALQGGTFQAWRVADGRRVPVAARTALPPKLVQWTLAPDGRMWARTADAQFEARVVATPASVDIEAWRPVPTVLDQACRLGTTLSRFFGQPCEATDVTFSHGLNRAVLDGHGPAGLATQARVDFYPPLAEPLPTSIQLARLQMDAPELQAAFFVDVHGAPVLINRRQAIRLLPADWPGNGMDALGRSWQVVPVWGAGRYALVTQPQARASMPPAIWRLGQSGVEAKWTPARHFKAGQALFAPASGGGLWWFQTDGVTQLGPQGERAVLKPQEGWQFLAPLMHRPLEPAVEFLATNGQMQRLVRVQLTPGCLSATEP